MTYKSKEEDRLEPTGDIYREMIFPAQMGTSSLNIWERIDIM